MEFVGPGVARVAWVSGVHWDSVGSNAPATVGWAELERSNAEGATNLAIMRQAMEHPAPDSGWVYQDTYQSLTNTPRISSVRERSWTQALVRAEIGELHRGNLDGAITNLHALAGLARLYRNEPTLVSVLIRVAIARLGLGGTWEALQAPGWDEPRLAALQQDWERVDFLDGMERAFMGDRAIEAVIMAEIRSASGRELRTILSGGTRVGGVTNNFLNRLWFEQALPMSYKMTGMDADELLHFTFMTKIVDATRLLKENRPWAEVNAINVNLMNELSKKFAGDRFHQYLMSELMIPNFTKAAQTMIKVETQRRLTIVVIALKRYELRHGQAAANLAALMPEFLASAPMDPMSGKELCYRLNANGTFVLYSTGEDGKDDGGQGGMDLWGGPDAVWPSAEVLPHGAPK